MPPDSNITVTFEGNLSEQNWPAMERLIRRGLENPEVYVSREILVLSAGATLIAAVLGSSSWRVLAMVAGVAFAAWVRSPHGMASWRKVPHERRVQSGAIGSAGVVLVREDGRWQVPWSTFTGHLIGEAGIALYLPDSWIAVPRSSVRSAEEWLLAVNMVQSEVPARRIANPFLDLVSALILWLTLLGLILLAGLWLMGWWHR